MSTVHMDYLDDTDQVEERYVSTGMGAPQKSVREDPNRVPYSHKCLQENATPNDYFKEISHTINLEQLYKVEAIHLENDSFNICPILLKIKDQTLRDQYEHPFLLQVWNDDYQKIYEEKLKAPLTMWGTSVPSEGEEGGYFYYQPGPGEEQHDNIIIFSIKDPKQRVIIDNIVKGPQYQYCSFDPNEHVLCVASHDLIKFVRINDDLFQEGDVNVDANELGIKVIDPNLKLMGIFAGVYAFETEDNQLDFNTLKITEYSDDQFIYQFTQKSEIVPRKIKGDSISKVSFQNSTFPYIVALKSSGEVDFYWDYQLKSSTNFESTFKVLDIDMSLTTMYFKVKDTHAPQKDDIRSFRDDGNGQQYEVYRLTYKDIYNVNWGMTELITDEDFEYNQICNENTIGFVRLYKDMMIISEEQCYLLVAHQQYVSLYDLLTNNWVKHMKFEEEITHFFQICEQETISQVTAESESDGRFVYVILKNGGVYIFEMKNIEKQDDPLLEIENSHDSQKFKIEGEIEEIVLDQQHKKFGLIVHTLPQEDEKEPKEYRIQVITKDVVFDITDKLKKDAKDPKDGKLPLDSETSCIILQGMDKDERSFLLFSKSNISRYSIENKTEYDYKKERKDAGQDEPEEGEADETQREWKDTLKVKSERLTIDGYKRIFVQDQLEKMTNKKTTAEQFKDFNQEQIEKEFEHIFFLGFHSAILYRNKNKQPMNLIFFDLCNIYVYNLKNKKLYYFKDHNINYILHFANSVNYVLCDDYSKLETSGLYYYNLEDAIKNIEKGECKSLPFKNFKVNLNSNIFYSPDEARIGYFNSLSHITIVPLLHINMVKFMAISKEEEYLAYRVIKDKFVALNKKGELQTWNLISGKYVGDVKAKEDWYHEFMLHDVQDKDADGYVPEDLDKNGRVILRSIEPLDEFDIASYYTEDQLRSRLNSQVTYVQSIEKEVHRWKVVEIISPTEVKVHFEFSHPYYASFQMLHFSKHQNKGDTPLMLEQQENFKVYLYTGEIKGNSTKWRLIRKIENFDADLFGDIEHFLVFYSPDLYHHIDLDQKNKSFRIRDTITNNVLHEVPKDLMTYGDMTTAPAWLTINKMKWIDNTKIRIVNAEGIEKIVDYSKNFLEIGSNTIPEFSKVKFEELDKWPFFHERQTLEIYDTEEYLLRKYQAYKSQFYLLKEKDPEQLRYIMYNVERQHMQYSHMSFTFLHWNLIESICSGNLEFKEINECEIQALLYNILPGGNTILHKFAANNQPDDIVTILTKSVKDLTAVPVEILYHIPIIQNFKMDTPLHVAMDLQDFKSVDNMLKYLKVYPMDHHSKAIKSLIPKMIEKGLPEMPDYLSSRLRQTNQCNKLDKANMKEEYKDIIPMQLWYGKAALQEEIMDKDKIEKRIKIEYIDLPEVYHYQDDKFNQFFAALAGTDNYSYFNIKAIQKMILFNYDLTKEFTIKVLLYPFIGFLILFTYYNDFFFENYFEQFKQSQLSTTLQTSFDADGWGALRFNNLVLQGGLLAFATYFFLNEVKQLSEEILPYFMSPWNYIDILPPVGIYLAVGMLFFYQDGYEVVIRQVLALSTFFMWMKLLYFMRIFRDTGYLIRMITTVMVDMRHFFLVLLIGIIAFGDSFLSISNGNTGDDRFTEGFIPSIIYTYTVILGGFDISTYENSIAYILVMILFLLCTVFNMIVMLNLLIAIISESFANVNNNAAQAAYQEMATLIAENNYLIPNYRKESYAKQRLLLMVITDLEQQDTEFQDPVTTLIHEVKEELINEIKFVSNAIDDGKKTQEAQQAKFDEVLAALTKKVGDMDDYVKLCMKPPENPDAESEEEYGAEDDAEEDD